MKKMEFIDIPITGIEPTADLAENFIQLTFCFIRNI